MFTQTVSGALGFAAGRSGLVARGVGASRGSGIGDRDAVGAGEGSGADVPAEELTVTSAAILLITFVEMPTRVRSLTDEYGRPAMIFLAPTAPIPGNASRSF